MFRDLVSQYNDFFDDLLEEEKASAYYLSCEQTSRNIWTSQSFQSFISGINPREPYLSLILRSFFRFYIGNSLELVSLFFSWIIFKIFSTSPSEFIKENRSYFITQTFLLEGRVLKENIYRDPYFPLLEKDHLKDYDNFTLGFYISDRFSFSKRIRMAKLLKGKAVYPDFCFLKASDFLKGLVFLFTYPFFHYGLPKKRETKLEKIFYQEIFEGIHQTRINSYFKYLVGLRLGDTMSEDSRILSWYENQVVHKLFIKGIRERKPQVLITGGELLLFPESMINYYPTLGEINHNLVPQKILYNGKYFLENGPSFLKEIAGIGPSLRYQNLFQFNSQDNAYESEKVLIALPYLKSTSDKLFSLCENTLSDKPCIFRIHPANQNERSSYENVILKNPMWEFAQGSLYDNFRESKVLITSGSGVAIEAIACRLNVLIFNRSDISSSYLPKMGMGEAWDFFDQPNELNIKIDHLLKRKNNEGVYNWYLENFFSPCNEENIKMLLGESHEN